MIDYYASEPHYWDHIEPVWQALPRDLKGPGGHVLVASYSDLLKVEDQPAIYMEHGVGFTFRDEYGYVIDGYAGAEDRRSTELFLCPNEYVARANGRAHPEIPARVVGCPKLDKWHNEKPKKRSDPPVVAFTFHWNGLVSPGTSSAYELYAPALESLRLENWEVIGHGHPRYQAVMQFACAQIGVEFVPDLEQVFDRADVLIADATSAAYEFASLDRPVVNLNTPAYHEEPDEGLRFWQHVPGMQVEHPEDLVDAVHWALEDLEVDREARHAAVEAAYPIRGTATEEAARAITDFVAR